MLIIKLIQFPFYRIFIDIFPDFQIILFIPNHMVVKRPLPDFSMRLVFLTICLPCRERFKRADHIRYSRGGALLRPVYGQQEVYVIRHDNIFLHANPISQFQRFDLRLTDTAKRAELSPAPTDIRRRLLLRERQRYFLTSSRRRPRAVSAAPPSSMKSAKFHTSARFLTRRWGNCR